MIPCLGRSLVEMKMKFKITNTKSVFNAIEKVFKNTLEADNMYSAIRDFAQERVKAQTRIGKSLPTGESMNQWNQVVGKQKELSDSYIKFRQRLKSGKSKSDSKPDPTFFKVRKSN